MKIVPVKIKFNTLYENRHLFTDDVTYNSLIISNAINLKVNLLNVEYYNTLDDDSKYHIYEYNNKQCNYIFNKNGFYVIRVVDVVFFSWEYYHLSFNMVEYLMFDILTIVE